MVPYFDSPVSTTAGKDTLVEGVPANSMYCHVVGLQWTYTTTTVYAIVSYNVCYVDEGVLTKLVNITCIYVYYSIEIP